MCDEALPDSLSTFLQERVEHYEDLQLLLFLKARAGTWWNSDAIGKHLVIAAETLDSSLARLTRCELVDVTRAQGERVYRYALRDEATAPTVDRLARACAERPLAVIRAMTRNALERLRARSIGTFDRVLSSRERR